MAEEGGRVKDTWQRKEGGKGEAKWQRREAEDRLSGRGGRQIRGYVTMEGGEERMRSRGRRESRGYMEE